jgi:hydrogenase maturation factor
VGFAISLLNEEEAQESLEMLRAISELAPDSDPSEA